MNHDYRTEFRQARLEAFLSHLELLTKPIDSNKPASGAGVEARAGELDDLTPGAARDFAVLLTTLAELPPDPNTPAGFATEADAREAVEHLFQAIEALDRASAQIRSFMRLSEALAKHLARLGTESEQAFDERLRVVVSKKRGDAPGPTASIDTVELGTLLQALVPYWFSPSMTDAERRNAFGAPPFEPQSIAPATCLKNLIRMRNFAVHQHLPGGARLVPYLQTSLTGLACLSAPEGRMTRIRNNFARRGKAPFLVTEYLDRVQATCVHRVPGLIASVVTKSDFVPRRVLRVLSDEERRKRAAELAERRNLAEQRMGLKHLLKLSTRLWLRAEGGSGKSELLRATARDLARDSQLRLLPIYVALNGYQPASQHASLMGLVRRALGLRPDEVLPRINGWTAVLLLDGYNEIDRVAQQALLQELEAFAFSWKELSVCMASRTAAPRDGDWTNAELLPFDDADIRGHLGSLARAGHGLDVEAFWRKAETRAYWSLAKQNPLFLTLCAAYALQTSTTDLPASEAQIFKRLVDDYYQREVEKTPGTPEVILQDTRKVLQELAWETFARDTMALPETDARVLADRQLGERMMDSLGTLLRAGLVERDGGEVRFIIQPLRDYLVAEYLLGDCQRPQADRTDEAPLDPLTRFEQKLEHTSQLLLQSRPAGSLTARNRDIPEEEHMFYFEQDEETAWIIERLQAKAKILQFAIELLPAQQRSLWVRELITRDLEDPIDYFWGGQYFLNVEAVIRLDRYFPEEGLLSAEDLVLLLRRANALGRSCGDAAMYAISSSQMSGLAAKLAREINVSPGMSLAEFPERVTNKRKLAQVARNLDFPGYQFYELWRMEPTWVNDKLEAILAFMVASAEYSNSETIVFFLKARPTKEVLAGAKVESWKDYLSNWKWGVENLDETPVLSLVFILQEQAEFLPVLKRLAIEEIPRTSQIWGLLELLYQQNTFDDPALIGNYRGEHSFLPSRPAVPTAPIAQKMEHFEAIYAVKEQIDATLPPERQRLN